MREYVKEKIQRVKQLIHVTHHPEVINIVSCLGINDCEIVN